MKYYLTGCLITGAIILILIASLFLLTKYIFEPMDAPDSYQDTTTVALADDVDTMQEIYAAIVDLVYARDMRAIKLHSVDIVFMDEQIEKQKGEMKFNLIVDDGESRHFADITVVIDMEEHAVTMIDVFYDQRTRSRRLKNGDLESWVTLASIDISQAALTTDEMFELVYAAMGDDAFSKFNNPQLILSCMWEDKWILSIMQKGSTPFATVYTDITLDPIGKEITGIEEFWRDFVH